MVSTDALRQRLSNGAWDVFSRADRLAQHINVYRACSYAISRNQGDGLPSAHLAERANAFLDEFATHDQDRGRTDDLRKRHLARIIPLKTAHLTRLMERAEQRPIHNLALLHQLSQTRLKIFGDKSAEASLSYARRATLKLHPDRAKDLEGWHLPEARYARGLPANYRYEHAKHGAAALLALHNGMKVLLAIPHYRDRLYSQRVLRGANLTLAQLFSDATVATVLGALITVARRRSLTPLLCVSGGTYGALLIALAYNVAAKQIAKRNTINCRQVTLYRGPVRRFGEV